MQYLEDQQQYEDRYDLTTIEMCLDRIEIIKSAAAEIKDARELQHLSREEKEDQMNMLANRYLMDVILKRYKGRGQTIAEWMDKDRRKQELQDNTLPPNNVACDKCGKAMHDTTHHLHSDLGNNDRVLFFFECDACNLRKAVFENGEKWIYKPTPCEKCGSDLKYDLRDEGKYEIWETICSSCSFREVTKTDREKRRKEDEQKAKREAELLAKYRRKFCLKKKEAEKYLSAFEELAFANDVYEYELQQLDIPEYEQTHNLQKLSAVEVEDLLNKSLEKEGFERLSMKGPEIERYVEIDFSVQDLNKSRNQKESELTLDDLLKKTLELTNWRVRDRVSYRLGFLTGRLRGYERDEDILEFLTKHKSKPQSKIELDQEKLEKYGHSNAVQLARLSAEFETKRRIRMKRYQTEPEGFILENHGDSYYSCNLCSNPLKETRHGGYPRRYCVSIVTGTCKRGFSRLKYSRTVNSISIPGMWSMNLDCTMPP
jgi:hypothetical protein